MAGPVRYSQVFHRVTAAQPGVVLIAESNSI